VSQLHRNNNDRLLDLLADRATEGLSDSETAELSSILAQSGRTDDPSIDHAAACLSLSMFNGAIPMPAHVRSRLNAAADGFATRGTVIAPRLRLTERAESTGTTRPGSTSTRGTFLPWLLAAASIAIAAVGWWPRLAPVSGTGSSVVSVVDRRSQLLTSGPDTITLSWGDFNALDTKEPPEIPGVTGDVVWSDARQEGYLRIVGLPVNAVDRERYQLWIIDAERGLEQRISGGIFDSACTTEFIIPIDPSLRVKKAIGFAVTIEKPTGTWVSDMKRRVCLALAKG
jgi:hypothetical protein